MNKEVIRLGRCWYLFTISPTQPRVVIR